MGNVLDLPLLLLWFFFSFFCVYVQPWLRRGIRSNRCYPKIRSTPLDPNVLGIHSTIAEPMPTIVTMSPQIAPAPGPKKSCAMLVWASRTRRATPSRQKSRQTNAIQPIALRLRLQIPTRFPNLPSLRRLHIPTPTCDVPTEQRFSRNGSRGSR